MGGIGARMGGVMAVGPGEMMGVGVRGMAIRAGAGDLRVDRAARRVRAGRIVARAARAGMVGGDRKGLGAMMLVVVRRRRRE